MSITDKIGSFPRRPGVYLFKDAKGDVLYVGKAKSLRDRVRSYFTPGRDERAQIAFLLRRTSDIDFIVTDTEKEALLLENTLIKEHRPRYNLSLRDDKGYVSIRIGAEHPFPGIWLTRRIRKDGALYFGPYDSAAAAREAVENIARYFRVRSCTDTEFANRVRPCLKHDIGRCTAPCAGRVSKEDYAAQVEETEMFLSGRSRELVERLDARMQAAAESTMFEEAARLRDAILMMKGLVEKQKVVRHGGGDHDAIGIARAGKGAAVCALEIRKGALIGKRIFHARDFSGSEGKLIEEFLLQRYRDGAEFPPRIALSHRPEASGEIAEILSERKGKGVRLLTPARGEMKRQVELARTNAREALIQRARRRDDALALERLGRRLGLKCAPDVIECVDISNLGGREAYGSLVTFVGGEPDKSRYRLYGIRTLKTSDDYGMMNEVLSRRYAVEGLSVEKAAERLALPLPDLLLVDGGKGQLGIAKRVLDEIGVRIPVAAIAKGEKKGQIDRVFIPGRKNPLNLRRGSKDILFLMRIRDEAHRFGIKAHRRRRAKATLGSR